jgi:hypothetical protein
MLHPRTGSVPSSQVKWLNQSINPRPLMFTGCYVRASAGEIDAARSHSVTMRRETRRKAKPGRPGRMAESRRDVTRAPVRRGVID